MEATFPRSARLLHSEDFDRVMGMGRRAHTDNLIVFIAPGISESTVTSRLGLAVGRKVGNAVRRNRWKRLIRDVFRTELRQTLGTVDLVVVVKAVPGFRRSRDEKAAAPNGARGIGEKDSKRIVPGRDEIAEELRRAIARLASRGFVPGSVADADGSHRG